MLPVVVDVDSDESRRFRRMHGRYLRLTGVVVTGGGGGGACDASKKHSVSVRKGHLSWTKAYRSSRIAPSPDLCSTVHGSDWRRITMISFDSLVVQLYEPTEQSYCVRRTVRQHLRQDLRGV